MNIYKLDISYDGTDFYGWQKQPNVETIQGTIEKTLNKIFKCSIRTMGSGRTDSGVHALSQIAKLEMELDIDASNIQKALNDNLPPTIRINELEKSDDFQPVFEAKAKTYRYYFSDRSLSPMQRRFVLDDCLKLDITKLNEAASKFIGEHSFHNYFCVGTEVKSYIRNIQSCVISNESISLPGHKPTDVYCLEIKGSGFLKQMVRLIMGTILNYSEGKITLTDIDKSLELESNGKLSKVAPAKGLMLYQVFY